MLILTRRIGESIRIGDDICVTVLEVKGQQVRLGIAAPTSVRVHREEVFHRIARERELAQIPATATAPAAPESPKAGASHDPGLSSPKVSVRRSGRKLLSHTIG